MGPEDVTGENEDADLVRRCLSGDQRACRDLVRRYERPVYSVLMRVVRRSEDAEDLVQETFVKVFRALERYDPERSFAAWIFTIASRLAIDHLRRRRVQTVSLNITDAGSGEERTMDVEDTGLKPDEITSNAEEEVQANELIDSLPEHYRIVVLLRHQQDLSYEEISEALNLPLGTVKARIHRARALLKDRIQGPPS
jgi:RNA polymerase sigma-70 factor (ECF subfamily)